MTCSFAARKASFNQSCGGIGGIAERLVSIPGDKVFSPPGETSQQEPDENDIIVRISGGEETAGAMSLKQGFAWHVLEPASR